MYTENKTIIQKDNLLQLLLTKFFLQIYYSLYKIKLRMIRLIFDMEN